MIKNTDDDKQKPYGNFETTRLLSAVDQIDQFYGCIEQGDHGEPPAIRDEILKLHELAMAVCNEGRKDKVLEMAELAADILEKIDSSFDGLRYVKNVVSDLLAASPSYLYD